MGSLSLLSVISQAWELFPFKHKRPNLSAPVAPRGSSVPRLPADMPLHGGWPLEVETLDHRLLCPSCALSSASNGSAVLKVNFRKARTSVITQSQIC